MEGMISKWILKKRDVKVHNGFNWLTIGFSGGYCESDNKSRYSNNFLKMPLAPWSIFIVILHYM
jgi:hypothetical protein